MKKRIALVSWLCMILFLSTSCSYYKMENSMREQVSQIGKEEATTGKRDQRVSEEQSVVAENGEVMTALSGITGIEYEILSAKLYENLSEAEISAKDLIPSDTEELAEDIAGVNDKCFLLLDMKITRKQKHMLTEDTEVLLSSNYIADLSREDVEAESPKYFDQPPQDATEDDYFKINVPQDESREVKVGYFVSKKLIEENKVSFVMDYNTYQRTELTLRLE